MDKAQSKENIIENKFKRSRQGNHDKGYMQQQETRCRYCEYIWSLGHHTNKPQSYGYQFEKDSKTLTNHSNYDDKKKNTIVVDAVKIGFQATNVEPIIQHIAK